jgi:hypothetical protein
MMGPRKLWPAALCLVACVGDDATVGIDTEGGETGTTGTASVSATLTTTMSGTMSATSTSSTTAPPTTTDTSGTTDTTDDPPPDMGENECTGRAAGIYCDGTVSIECDGDGNVVEMNDCSPDYCIDGMGCVVCLDGQYDCQGNAVYQCDFDADPPAWEQIEVCAPEAGEGCDLATGTCTTLEPVGDATPTGDYHVFADLGAADGFNGGYDVDSYDDLVYVTNFSSAIDVYQVEVEDTDDDGDIEPNQHPDDPANTGVIEQRSLSFVESIDWPSGLSVSTQELYVLDDRLFIGGNEITEYIFAGGATSTVSTAPAWAARFAQIAYDDVHGIWYGSNENFRRVMQYDTNTDTWGLAFLYP